MCAAQMPVWMPMKYLRISLLDLRKTITTNKVKSCIDIKLYPSANGECLSTASFAMLYATFL